MYDEQQHVTTLCYIILFVVVDSLKPTEVIVSFTSFSQWLDQPVPPSQAAPTTTASNPSHANVTKAGKESKDPKTPDRPPATAEPPSDVGSVVGGAEGM